MQNPITHAQYDFSTYRLGDRPVSERLLDVYQALSRLPHGSLVLDAGCGDGHFGRCAPHNRPYRIVGVDVSASAIERYSAFIRRNGLPDNAIQADLVDGIELGSFAAAVSWRVLHALGPEEQIRVCQAVHRVLPVGARFYVAVLSDLDKKRKALGASYRGGALNDCSKVMGLSEPWPLYFFSFSAVLELARASGFEPANISLFQEETGFQHLIARGFGSIDYWFAEFRKIKSD